MSSKSLQIAIIGGGPAGLMAAQNLLDKGFDVHLFDAMPSLGRKFLMAGKSGLNLSHNEDFDIFLSRYTSDQNNLEAILRAFTPNDIRQWAENLGIETFVGSSGRIFPTDFKAAPLLRSWLRDLRQKGLTTHVHHRWNGWSHEGNLCFKTPNGPLEITATATVLALGGISWPKLGSDGSWLPAFETAQIDVSPFQASNCGFSVAWSDHFMDRFAGDPIKAVTLSVGSNHVKGEFVITKTGIESGAVYSQSARLREQLNHQGTAELFLDLTPDRSVQKLLSALNKPQGSKSLSTHIKRATRLSGAKAALLRECLSKDDFLDMSILAQKIKKLPIAITGMAPIEQAISSVGGVSFGQLDQNLMIRQHPGLFVAGEMLDWDAPTGGYLLTACFALGRHAGLGVAQWLNSTSS